MSAQPQEGAAAQQELKRELSFFIDVADVNKEEEKELKQLQKKGKHAGFRPGKVPMDLVRRQHGMQVRYEVVNRLVSEQLQKELAALKIEIAGAPSVAAGNEEKEGKMHFVATYEVFPEVTLPDLSSVEVKRFVCPVGDTETENTINILRQQRTTYEVAEGRASEKGDRVKVDFEGKIDGEVFQGGKANDFVFLVGSGQMLPEFDEAALGLKAGESKTFDLAFPENYHGKEVAGKTAQFTITMKEVAAPKLPELDAAFVKSLGQEDGDVDAFRKEVLSNIQMEAKERLQLRTKLNIFKELLKTVDFPLPEAMVQDELNGRVQAARAELKQRGVPNHDTVELPMDMFKEEAQKRVKLGLILRELVQKEGIKATPDQVRAKIEAFAQRYETPSEFISHCLTNANARAEMENRVLEENMIDFVLSKAKVVEEPVAFEVLMGA